MHLSWSQCHLGWHQNPAHCNQPHKSLPLLPCHQTQQHQVLPPLIGESLPQAAESITVCFIGQTSKKSLVKWTSKEESTPPQKEQWQSSLILLQRLCQGNGKYGKHLEQSAPFLYCSLLWDHPLTQQSCLWHYSPNNHHQLSLHLSHAFPFYKQGICHNIWHPPSSSMGESPPDNYSGDSDAIGCRDQIVGGNDWLVARVVTMILLWLQGRYFVITWVVDPCVVNCTGAVFLQPCLLLWDMHLEGIATKSGFFCLLIVVEVVRWDNREKNKISNTPKSSEFWIFFMLELMWWNKILDNGKFYNFHHTFFVTK